MAGQRGWEDPYQTPAVGFAAALKDGERWLDEAPDAPQSQYPHIDKEHGRREAVESGSHIPQIHLEIGRRVVYKSRGSDWRNVPKMLARANSGMRAIEPIDHTRYSVDYLTPDEMDDIVSSKFGDAGRGDGPAKQKRAIRDLSEKINRYLGAQYQADQDELFEFSERSPEESAKAWDLAADPDNPKWFDTDKHGATLPENENLPWESVSGLWIPGEYAVELEEPTSSTSCASVTLLDKMGTLRKGRERLVNALESEFGLDVSGVQPSDEWVGRFGILRAIGGRSIVGLRYRIPALPATATLKPPHVHEI